MSDWQCYARPAALGGKTCGYANSASKPLKSASGLVCCEECGCTKLASDSRRERALAATQEST